MSRNKQRIRRRVKAVAKESRTRVIHEQTSAVYESSRQLADKGADLMRQSFVRAGEIDGLIKRCKKQRALLRRKGRQFECDHITDLIAQLSRTFSEEVEYKNNHLEKTRFLNNSNRNQLHFPCKVQK